MLNETQAHFTLTFTFYLYYTKHVNYKIRLEVNFKGKRPNSSSASFNDIPVKHMGECRYTAKHSRPWRCTEVNDQRHASAALSIRKEQSVSMKRGSVGP
jgi:hypothetical protein